MKAQDVLLRLIDDAARPGTAAPSALDRLRARVVAAERAA